MAANSSGRLVKRTAQNCLSLFPFPLSVQISKPSGLSSFIRTTIPILPIRDSELDNCQRRRSFFSLPSYSTSPSLTHFLSQSPRDSRICNNSLSSLVVQRSLVHGKPLLLSDQLTEEEEETTVVEPRWDSKVTSLFQYEKVESRKRVHLIISRLQELQLSCNRFTCAQRLESSLQTRFKYLCGSVSEANAVVVLQHLQGSDFPLASAFFQWAKKQPRFKLNKRVVSAFMRIAGRAKEFEVLENLLENFSTIAGEPADVITYSDVIKSYGDAYRFDDVMRMYARMIDQGLHPTVRTFSILIRSFTRGRRPLDALKYLRQMEEFDCKPNAFLYSEMIGMYGRMKQLRKAENLLEEMAAGGEPANIVIYNRLICQCCYVNDGDKAMSLLHQMIRIGVVPDAMTFSSLLDFFVKRDKEKEINIVLEKAQSCDGVELNVYFYSIWMNMHIRKGEISEAESVFALMKSKNIKPTSVSYGTLLNGYAKKHLFEKVKSTVEDMRAELGTVNSSTYCVLVSYWLQATSEDDRRRVFESCELSGYWWHNILVQLLQPPIENEGFQESHWVKIGDTLKRLLLEESSGQDDLVMTAVALLAKKKLEGRASRLWKEARTVGLLRGVSYSNALMLTIDLHVLHPLASLAVLSSEFDSLWRDFQQGLPVPEYIQIITGWGRSMSIEQAESLGVESRLKWQVADILQQLNSPFVIPGDNEGRQVASSSEVKSWLEKGSTREALLLRDSASE